MRLAAAAAAFLEMAGMVQMAAAAAVEFLETAVVRQQAAADGQVAAAAAQA